MGPFFFSRVQNPYPCHNPFFAMRLSLSTLLQKDDPSQHPFFCHQVFSREPFTMAGWLDLSMTRPKGNHRENEGFSSPDFSPELSPKTLGKKGENCFLSKITGKEIWGKSGLMTPFSLWFSFGLASQRKFGSFGPQATQSKRNHRED